MTDSGLLEWIKGASQDLYENVQGVVDESGAILLGLAAVGVLASAIVNQLKDVVRPHYFYWRIRRQLMIAHKPTTGYRMLQFIVATATGNERAFYKQDLEALFSSIGRVKNLILMNPSGKDVEPFLTSWFDARYYPSGFQVKYKKDLDSFIESNGADKKKEVGAALDAQLLGLKIRIKHDWDRNRRWAATVVAVALVFAFLWGTSSPWPTLLFAVVGGLLAPFSHDLLKNLRTARVK